MATPSRQVDLLIIGAGWTSTFLMPQLEAQRISYARTTTTGRDGSIMFKFDPDSDNRAPYMLLPFAKTILITMPLRGVGQSKKLTEMYKVTHTHSNNDINWIQLGSTGIYKGDGYHDHDSDYDKTNERAIAEDELRDLAGCVLNLAGLWGDQRIPQNWVSRVAKDKEQLKSKGALHLIHGEDVARAIIAVHRRFYPGARWILTDRHVYDWWDLVDSWGDELSRTWKGKKDERPEYRKWVQECMDDEKVRTLPRDTAQMGRILDSNQFWKTMGILPNRILQR